MRHSKLLLCLISYLLAGLADAADHTMFHGDAARTGWNDRERELTPQRLRNGDFVHLWNSPPLSAAGEVPARLFASPLYLADLRIATASGAQRHDIVIAASTTGIVAAIAADERQGTAAGQILWQRRVTSAPCGRGSNGILATPIADRRAMRLYVTSCDDADGWRVHALRLDTGEEIAGSPLRNLAAGVNAPGINRNGANAFPSGPAGLQRGALNLTNDRKHLLVTFGGEPLSGWLIAIDTATFTVSSAFSVTPRAEEGNGGLWASGGTAIDARGTIFFATGSSVLNTLAGMGDRGVYPESAGNWGQSIVALRFNARGALHLVGTYTPFNYCQVGGTDIDLGSGTPIVVDLPKKKIGAHLLVHTGSKQGNAYLLDRDHMPGGLTIRQPCATDLRTGAEHDRSLLPPDAQPQFGTRGPLNVFGPYSERYGMGDFARSRTTPAYFRDARGRHFVFATGNAKISEDSAIDGGPGLVRLEIVTRNDSAPFLKIDATQKALAFRNPGSPFITSNGTRHAIVWVTDVNAPRSATLYGPDAPRPFLYAIDASTLEILWRSLPGELQAGGKYNEPAVVDGRVFIGTDRIQAYGLRHRKPVRVASAAPAVTPDDVAARHLDSPEISPERIDARVLYQTHCAACHELDRADIPHRRRLEQLDPTLIRVKLTLGTMQSAARTLTDSEIAELARWLANKSQ